jgi:hypothetical protein
VSRRAYEAVDIRELLPQEKSSATWGATVWATLDVMRNQLPDQCRELLDQQRNIIARWQLMKAGLSETEVDNLLRSGRWQLIQRAVYAAFSGDLDREALLWAAILRVGEGAALSHWTAAERHQLIKGSGESIHVTVPTSQNPERWGKIPGVVLHRSVLVSRALHPMMTPPCTRIEDTVLDLVAESDTFDEAYTWMTRAVGGRLTTAERLRASLDSRHRVRWRRDVELALGDAASGVHSWLERQYLRGVEIPHGLPAATRQARVAHRTRNTYLDNLYQEYDVCVELDGAIAHPASEQWRDIRRDKHNLVYEGIVTIRLGFPELRGYQRCCETAAEVANLLVQRGLPAEVPHPCGPTCPVGRRPR